MCAATTAGGAWEFFLPTGRQAGVFWEFLYRWEFCYALIISASAAFFARNYFFKNGSFFGCPGGVATIFINSLRKTNGNKYYI